MKDKVLAHIIAIAIIIFSFVSVIDICAFNEAFYAYEYEKNDVADIIGIDDGSLDEATDVLLGYIKGRYETLDLEVKIDDDQVEMFNAKEKEHMVDVRDLYTAVSTVRYIALAVFLISIIYLSIKYKGKIFKLLANAYKRVLIVFASIVAALAVFALSDFYLFWTTFHRIFFSNDLWLLDPLTDRLIMMVPETFFFDLVMMIIVVFLTILVIVYLAMAHFKRKEMI